MKLQQLQFVRLSICEKPMQNSRNDLKKGLRVKMFPSASSKCTTVLRSRFSRHVPLLPALMTLGVVKEFLVSFLIQC